ncbi:MAG: lipopolysaccharide heptosyltransferase I [Acidiferrobacter sp.]
MNILIVKTSSLGDVVHNLPMVSDIHARFPDARIDWVVEKAFADIPALHPAIRTVIPLELRRWLRAPGWRQSWREFREFRTQLRETRYDIILDSQGLIKSAVIARLSLGPVSGPDRRSARELLAAYLYQRGVPVPRERHAVWRNRTLGSGALGYPLPATAPDYGILAPASVDLGPKPYCVALHASSRASKLWQPAHWVALGKELNRQGLRILLPSGSAAELTAAQDIACAIGPQALALARYRVKDLAAILGGAEVVIGVDTGLVHLAAALKRPTIGIFCDSDPAQTGVLAETGAINLGGFGMPPAVAEVIQALHQLGVLGVGAP